MIYLFAGVAFLFYLAWWENKLNAKLKKAKAELYTLLDAVENNELELRRYVVEVAEELERIKKPINELIMTMKEEENAKAELAKCREEKAKLIAKALKNKVNGAFKG